MPMTWLAWTIETFGGQLAGDPPDGRLVADEDEPVLGCARAWSRAPGTTSAGPWSPPIASTATRTPRASAARSARVVRPIWSTSVSAAASSTPAGLRLDRQAAVVVAAVRADVVRQLQLVAVRALLERRHADGEVGAALALAGMRDASLGYTHGFVGSFDRVSGRCAAVLAPGTRRDRRDVAAEPTAECTARNAPAPRASPAGVAAHSRRGSPGAPRGAGRCRRRVVVDAVVEPLAADDAQARAVRRGRAARSARRAGSPRGRRSRGRARGGRSGGRRRARRRVRRSAAPVVEVDRGQVLLLDPDLDRDLDVAEAAAALGRDRRRRGRRRRSGRGSCGRAGRGPRSGRPGGGRRRGRS